MQSYKEPHIIDFSKLGDTTIGYISIAQWNSPPLPFDLRRVFWTYHTPESIVRGRHAHYSTEQVLIAVSGRIVVTTESVDGNVHSFVLDRPDKGLYIPPNVWHTMQYAHTAVQLVFASTEFSEKDYIRDYSKFKEVWK